MSIKRKTFNIAMSIISIVYLLGAIILTFLNKIQFDWKNLFNTDGLTILGCLFALGELFLSNRNKMSRYINQLIISNKYINYRIDIATKSSNCEIEDISDIFEKYLRKYLNLNNIKRKPLNKFSSSKWSIKYEDLPIEVDYIHSNNDFYMRLSGKTKYGNINKKISDIVYLSTVIKILFNNFLEDATIRDKLKIIRIDIVLKMNGSQLKSKNIFNETLEDIADYNLKIIKDLSEECEVIVNRQEIRLSSVNKGAILDGFIELTNIICNIE